jgi:hypothetical protein
MSKGRLYAKMLAIETAAAGATGLGLSLADMLVFIRLVSLYNRDKGYAWPGKSKLAAELGITVRQVNRSINRLIAANLLEVTRGGGRHTNQYVPVPAMSERPFEHAAQKRQRMTAVSPLQGVRDDRAVPTHDRCVIPGMTARSSESSYSSSYLNPSVLPTAPFSKNGVHDVYHCKSVGEFLRRVESLLPNYQNGKLSYGKETTVRRWLDACVDIWETHDLHDPLAQWANRLAGELQYILDQNGA